MSSQTNSDFVKNILEGAKRRLSVPIKKKDPITPDLLLKMYDNMFCDKQLIYTAYHYCLLISLFWIFKSFRIVKYSIM